MRLSAFLSVFNHWALTLSVKGIPGLASAAYQQRNLLRWIFRFSQSQTLWIPRIRKRHNETQINQALIIFMDGEQINIPFICCLPGSIRRMTDNAQLSWKISFWINICFRSLNRIDTDMFKHRQRRWTWEQKKKNISLTRQQLWWWFARMDERLPYVASRVHSFALNRLVRTYGRHFYLFLSRCCCERHNLWMRGDADARRSRRRSTTRFHKHVKLESKMLRTVICLCLNRWGPKANVNSRRTSGHVAHVNSENSDWRAISETLHIYMRCCRVKRLECRRTKVSKSVDAFLRVFHFLHASSEISSEKCVSEKVKTERRRTKSCRTTMFRGKWKR